MSLTPLLIAISLLTAIPVAKCLKEDAWTEANRSKAIDYYGLVGILIAVMLILVTGLAHHSLPDSVASAVILIAWVSLTGALHLDGLADCSDAAAAGHAKPSQYLAVMKSPEVGAFAVVVVCLHLLLKLSMLNTLLSEAPTPSVYWLLLTAIVVSRVFAAIYQQTTLYAREQGMGLHSHHRYYVINSSLLALLIVALAVLFSGSTILTIFIASALLLLLWRHFWVQRIGGYTGDCIGAFIELNESLCLMIGVILWSHTQ